MIGVARSLAHATIYGHCDRVEPRQTNCASVVWPRRIFDRNPARAAVAQHAKHSSESARKPRRHDDLVGPGCRCPRAGEIVGKRGSQAREAATVGPEKVGVRHCAQTLACRGSTS
jgi:hypothetical protein